MNEIYDARTRKLEKELREAALNLFQHTQSPSFVIDAPEVEGVVIAAGYPEDLIKLLEY